MISFELYRSLEDEGFYDCIIEDVKIIVNNIGVVYNKRKMQSSKTGYKQPQLSYD